MAVNADGTRLYVTRNGANTVSVINTATNTTTATITVGALPNSAALNTDGTRLYVTNQNTNTVSVINTATNTVTATIAVGRQPNAITVIGNRAFISAAGDNRIQVLDTTTNTITATITVAGPLRQHRQPRRHPPLCRQRHANTISVINTATNTVTATIPTGTTLPYKLAITPDGTRLFLTSIGSWSTPAGTVTVIDTTTNTTIATLPTNTWSFGVAVAPNGSYTYLTNRNTNTLTKIGAPTDDASTANQCPAPSPLPSEARPDQRRRFLPTGQLRRRRRHLTYTATSLPSTGPSPRSGAEPSPTPRHKRLLLRRPDHRRNRHLHVGVTDGHGGAATRSFTYTGPPSTTPTSSVGGGRSPGRGDFQPERRARLCGEPRRQFGVGRRHRYQHHDRYHPVGDGPRLMTMSAAGDRLFVAGSRTASSAPSDPDGWVSVINTCTNAVVGSRCAVRCAISDALSANGSRLYVSAQSR